MQQLQAQGDLSAPFEGFRDFDGPCVCFKRNLTSEQQSVEMIYWHKSCLTRCVHRGKKISSVDLLTHLGSDSAIPWCKS